MAQGVFAADTDGITEPAVEDVSETVPADDGVEEHPAVTDGTAEPDGTADDANEPEAETEYDVVMVDNEENTASVLPVIPPEQETEKAVDAEDAGTGHI